jgi:large subunit ribosomal protein L19
MANKLEFNDVQVSVGDMVKVHFGEGNPFDGIVIGIKGEAENKSFTVRKVGVGGVGIERIFPLASPLLTKIEIKKKGKARRAKLYYLRKQTRKQLKKLTRGVVKELPKNLKTQKSKVPYRINKATT